MTFSDAVKKAMEATGVNTPELARLSGYSYQHILDLLAGRRRWNEDSLSKVCDVLGIGVEIVERKGDQDDLIRST